MKKFIILLVTIVLMGAFLAVPAYALKTFPVTDFKFTGHSAIWSAATGTYMAPGYIPGIGDKVWGIGQITGTVDPSTGDAYPLNANEEYTYYLGGYIVTTNPFPGFYRLSVDPASPIVDPATGAPVAYAVVWKDTTPDYALPTGPSVNPLWGPIPFPLVDPSGTILNDGTPWLTGILEGDPTWAAGEVFQSSITNFGPPPGGPTGSDQTFIHVQSLCDPSLIWDPTCLITGSFNNSIIANYYGLGNSGLTRDVQILNTMQPPMVAGYYNRDNDPATAAIPEPATMILLGAGLLGIGGFAWHRKSK